ncbi:SDR family NAD(P)-dependent oxidoreductase [Nonomuraea sp. K274]|uniref:SDR family NAD(P)-dependent oxidoreductase n=1 Tax=Nonomuraea cypriaca TaxID=1187855 RepID=A0A931AII7_9ACTN|nr:type I polyketide synthase [Nonomuraea cypriaca]MBF8189752.1 SDR family NAD(P)-dependent oxidoreductase [Nonomuraea cypriaca]
MDVERIEDWLVHRVAAEAGLPPADVDTDAPFAAFGLDSPRITAMAGDLQRLLSQPVSPTLPFEFPTVSTLANHLSRKHAPPPEHVRALEPPPSERVPAPDDTPAPGRPAQRGTPAALGRPAHQAAMAGKRPSGREGEPIAVTGLACRMPGAGDLGAFWRLLESGTDAIGDIPADRWEGSPRGRAGLLDDVSGFDAPFFRIGGDEALRMDPQQRILLETTWDALEDAGEVPARLRGSRTGVYLGISANDYAYRQLDPAAIDRYTPSGNALSVAAGRLSYVFGLRGPALAVDTACSSSLVAVHLACRAIRSDECEAAVVAGVNLLLDPAPSTGLGLAGMLAQDGRCKAFDASADGYVRGEGCGVAVLKPLSKALAQGDRVYALILGTATNQDGATNGLTAPNPAAQREVVEAALRDAATGQETVRYVECHGTGTALGDPVEAHALGTVLKGDRELLIGSVKTNIGHLEAAAGIAGLIKVALSLHHGRIPPSLHFTTPNPHIPFTDLGLRVVTRPESWPGGVAGLSSFGFSGTNAHIVMSPPPPPPAQPTARPRSLLLPISARTESGLARAAAAWADHLTAIAAAETTSAPPAIGADLVFTAATRRTHHRPYRAAVIGADAAELAARLRAIRGTSIRVSAGDPRVTFVFSGQGVFADQAEARQDGQDVSPGPLAAVRELLDSDPLFRSSIRRCDERLDGVLGWSIERVLSGETEADLQDTAVAQPLIVAVQLALVRVWRSLGIEPAAVVGHSVGEISAAVTAGLLDAGTGLRLAADRGRLMSPARGGRMLAVGLSREAAERRAGSDVTVAAINAPGLTVLSGAPAALEEVRRGLADAGTFVRWLPVEYAFHGPAMDPAARALAELYRDLEPGKAKIPFYSSVLGERADDRDVDGAYWARNVREPVDLAGAVSALLPESDALVEVGAKPVLQAALRETSGGVLVTATLGGDGLLGALGALYTLGCAPRWEHLHPSGGRVVSTPGYPWEHRMYWLDRPEPRRAFEREVALDPADLAEHRVNGLPVFPAAGYIRLAVSAARAHGLPEPITLDHLDLPAPLIATDDAPAPYALVTLTPEADDLAFSITTGTGPDETPHATGRLLPTSPTYSTGSAAPTADPTGSADRKGLAEATGPERLAAVEDRCSEPVPVDLLYSLLDGAGLAYGPRFRGVRWVRRGDGEAVADISGDAVPLLDAALHPVFAAAPADLRKGGAAVPVGVETVRWWADPGREARCHARVTGSGDGEIRADVTIYDSSSRPCVELTGLRMRHAPASREKAEFQLYETVWRESPAEGSAPKGRWLLVPERPGSDCSGLAEAMAAELARRGATALVRTDDTELAGRDDTVPVGRDDAAPVGRDDTAPVGRDDAAPVGRDDAAPVGRDGTVPVGRGAESRPDGDARQVEGVAGVVYLPSMDGGYEDAVVDVARLVRALSFAGPGTARRLIVVTRGARAENVTDPRAAAPWGLLRTAAIENPVLRPRCVDLDPQAPTGSTGSIGSTSSTVSALCDELADDAGETEVAYRDGRRLVARLNELRMTPRRTLTLRPDATYVITGGTGTLGLLAADRLAQRGARHLALLSRRPPAPDAEDTLARLREAGVEVRLLRADVADRDALARALATARASGPPIRGVLHAAGVLRDGALLDMPEEALREVLAPKLRGAWNLHELTLADPIEWFVLYASAAGVLGSPGQANYSAANAVLDALAHHRRGRGLPATAIDWGPWGEAGMAADAVRLRTAGSVFEPGDALDLLENLMTEDRPQTMALPFDLRSLLQFYPAQVGVTFFDEVATHEDRSLNSIGVRDSARPDLAAPYVAPRNGLERRIAAIWQKALAIDPIGVQDGFFELGGDSVFGHRILGEINRALEIRIDPASAFADFTVAHLAELAARAMRDRLERMTDEEAARLLTPAADQGMTLAADQGVTSAADQGEMR